MSDDVNSNNNSPQNGDPWENFQPVPPKEHFGCGAWLGVLVLLGAIGAVLYFLVIKPAAEKSGISVDEKISEIKSNAAEALKDGSVKALEVGAQGADAVRSGTDSVRKKAGNWWKKAGEKKDQATEYVAEKRKSFGKKVDSTEKAVAETAEKAERVMEKNSEAAEKVQKKAKEKVDSWY